MRPPEVSERERREPTPRLSSISPWIAFELPPPRGPPGLLGWRDRCQRRPALARLPALRCPSRATEPKPPFVLMQEKSASQKQIFVRAEPKPAGTPGKR